MASGRSIICADFLEHDLADAVFDVIICDPPYLAGKDFGKNAGLDSDSMPLDDFLVWIKHVIDKCRSHLAPNGLLYVYNFPELAARISSLYPLDEQRLLQWHYSNKNVQSVKFWQRSHESIVALWHPDRGAKAPDLDINAIRDPYGKAHQAAADRGATRKGTVCRFNRKGRTTKFLDHGGALPRDVIQVPALAGGAGKKERWLRCFTCNVLAVPPSDKDAHRDCESTWSHPTQKPAKLTEKLIKSAVIPEHESTPRVLVPFAGSGAECLVAETLGCAWTATEINPDFVAFANEMLRLATADNSNESGSGQSAKEPAKTAGQPAPSSMPSFFVVEDDDA